MTQISVFRRINTSMMIVLLASACSIDLDDPVESEVDDTVPVLTNDVANAVEQPITTVPELTDTADLTDTTTSSDLTAPSETTTLSDSTSFDDQSTSSQVELDVQQPDTELSPEPDLILNTDPTPDPTLESGSRVDQSGIATSELTLADLLETEYVVENERVIPTSTWICTDVFEENRSYNFYEAGVLNPSRGVLIERTLNSTDETRFNDITFFWSVTSTDSVLLSSLIAGEDGTLVPSGQQYDISTIRFTELESRPVFSAQSLLRGSLTCVNISLR